MPRVIGPHNDLRFSLHHAQPRSFRLTRQQRALCKRDPAFSEALRKRVSNPARWEAFIAGRSWYEGKPCKRCGSTRRRVRSCDCYDCLLTVNRSDWSLMRSNVTPPSKNSRDGYLDRMERTKRERAGECERFAYGAFTATQYPTGRLAVHSDIHSIHQPDLARLEGRQVHALCDRFPDLVEVLRWAGWID